MQALEVIHELQKQFPIKRSPMRLRYIVPEQNVPSLLDKLNAWSASIVSNDQSGNQQRSIVSPSFFIAIVALLIFFNLLMISSFHCSPITT